MNAEFCKQYTSLFLRWKNRLRSDNSNDENFHVALKKLFLRCLTLQFCIENKWSSFTLSSEKTSIYSTSLFPHFTSHHVAQSPLFQMQSPELDEVPDSLLLDIFGSKGLFERFSFSADEYAHKKNQISPAVIANLFEKLAIDRQNEGTFYTSSDVVNYMAQKSLEKRFTTAPSLQQMLDMTLIDPACGSGALLIGAAEQSFQMYKRIHPSSKFDFKSHLVSNCLYGVDLDQAALDVTQTRFWFWMNQGRSEPLSLEGSNLVQGNSVTGSNPQEVNEEIGFEFRKQFPTVFSSENPGFDIVLANPPYIRQESIDKTVKHHVRNHKIFQGIISGMSDLYAYFYARTTQLLKAEGVSGFICSNTWMDVRYGRLLQHEFLTRYSDIEIIGSQLSRQFDTAEINTVMTFMTKRTVIDSYVQFTLLKTDFNSSIHSDINRTSQTILQSQLLQLGMNLRGYVGTKWSLYLHAPRFYHQLMDKHKHRFISISELCQRTLRNNLRVLPKGYSVQLNVSTKRPSMPYLKSFKDVESVRVFTDEQHAVIHSDLSSSLLSTNYCRPDVVANRFFNSRMFFIEGGDFFVSDSFFLGKLKEEFRIQDVILSLNSTFSLFLLELCGRKGLGGGLLSFYGPEFNAHKTLHPSVFSQISDAEYRQFVERKILDVFEECGFDKHRASLPPKHEHYIALRAQKPNPIPDRKRIDDVAFNALDLTLDERNEIYWCLCESVLSRLQKASSV